MQSGGTYSSRFKGHWNYSALWLLTELWQEISPFIYVHLNIYTHTCKVLFGERDWKISISHLNRNQWVILKSLIIFFVPLKLITKTLTEGILPFMLQKKIAIFKKVFLKLQVRRNHSNLLSNPVHHCYNLYFLLDFRDF